ncbi:MAG: DOPA 4,5-dioxygenase family protein [Pseudomonadota bacterium]
MNEPKRPVNIHKAYHAHVYFDETSREFARSLCDRIRDEFELQVGRFHERPIGPHPTGSCQIIFGMRDFDEFIGWLQRHRGELTVLIHGLTGDDYADHTDNAYWLGDGATLNLEIFSPNRT